MLIAGLIYPVHIIAAVQSLMRFCIATRLWMNTPNGDDYLAFALPCMIQLSTCAAPLSGLCNQMAVLAQVSRTDANALIALDPVDLAVTRKFNYTSILPAAKVCHILQENLTTHDSA